MGRGTGEAAGQGEQYLPRLLSLTPSATPASHRRAHVKKNPARLERAGSPTSCELEAGGPSQGEVPGREEEVRTPPRPTRRR